MEFETNIKDKKNVNIERLNENCKQLDNELQKCREHFLENQISMCHNMYHALKYCVYDIHRMNLNQNQIENHNHNHNLSNQKDSNF